LGIFEYGRVDGECDVQAWGAGVYGVPGEIIDKSGNGCIVGIKYLQHRNVILS